MTFQFASVIAEIMRYSKPMDDLITCVNGVFVRAKEAVLPVADRGMRFGDGVFETISLHKGVPYQWDRHHTRLMSGLQALRIVLDDTDLKAAAKRVIQHNQADSGSIRISISRGVGSRGYLPVPTKANWVIEWVPAHTPTARECRLWVSQYRRIPLNCLPTNEKLAQGVNSILAIMEAHDHGRDEALQLSSSGLVACASSANIGWIKGRSIFTPALDTGCLNGTTRARLMELSPYPFHACSEPLESLETADAVFICNSRLDVCAVSAIEPVGFSYAIDHPIMDTLYQLIQSDRENYFSNNKLYWLEK